MKKINIVLSLFLIVVSLACAHKSRHRQQLEWAVEELSEHDTCDDSQNNESVAITNNKNIDDLLKCVCDTKQTQLLVRDGYVALYSLTTHCPVYVAWKLTQDRVDGDVKRSNSFHPDEEIDEKNRVTNEDYKGSGWSRGHMCPAADNKDSELRMEQSFILTNICPQDMKLNSGRWNDLENKCRSWAQKGNTIYVICGPIFFNKEMRWIGQNVNIAVPDAFYKVALIIEKNGQMKMAAYMFDNEPVEEKLQMYKTTVDNVEQVVGIDFFSALDDKIENDLEGQA